MELLPWVKLKIKKLKWWNLSKNPAAINLLKANPDKIDRVPLSLNPAAMDLLKDNLDELDWSWLSRNPAIFTHKYSLITLICSGLYGKFTNWYLFLCEGLYDPRLLIYINQFAELKLW